MNREKVFQVVMAHLENTSHTWIAFDPIPKPDQHPELYQKLKTHPDFKPHIKEMESTAKAIGELQKIPFGEVPAYLAIWFHRWEPKISEWYKTNHARYIVEWDQLHRWIKKNIPFKVLKDKGIPLHRALQKGIEELFGVGADIGWDAELIVGSICHLEGGPKMIADQIIAEQYDLEPGTLESIFNSRKEFKINGFTAYLLTYPLK